MLNLSIYEDQMLYLLILVNELSTNMNILLA